MGFFSVSVGRTKHPQDGDSYSQYRLISTSHTLFSWPFNFFCCCFGRLTVFRSLFFIWQNLLFSVCCAGAVLIVGFGTTLEQENDPYLELVGVCLTRSSVLVGMVLAGWFAGTIANYKDRMKAYGALVMAARRAILQAQLRIEDDATR